MESTSQKIQHRILAAVPGDVRARDFGQGLDFRQTSG